MSEVITSAEGATQWSCEGRAQCVGTDARQGDFVGWGPFVNFWVCLCIHILQICKVFHVKNFLKTNWHRSFFQKLITSREIWDHHLLIQYQILGIVKVLFLSLVWLGKARIPSLVLLRGVFTLLFADVMHPSVGRYDFSQNILLLKAS